MNSWIIDVCLNGSNGWKKKLQECNRIKEYILPWVVHRKSRKKVVVSLSACVLFLLVLVGINLMNEKKLKFKLELAQNDPECMKWARECEEACESNPPEKEKS